MSKYVSFHAFNKGIWLKQPVIHICISILSASSYAQTCDESDYDDPAKWTGGVQGSYGNDIAIVPDENAECGQAISVQLNREVGSEFNAAFRTPLPSGVPDVAGVEYTVSLKYRAQRAN